MQKTGKYAFFSFFNGAAPPHKIIQMDSNCTGMFIRTWNNFWQPLYVKVPKLFFSLHRINYAYINIRTYYTSLFMNKKSPYPNERVPICSKHFILVTRFSYESYNRGFQLVVRSSFDFASSNCYWLK